MQASAQLGVVVPTAAGLDEAAAGVEEEEDYTELLENDYQLSRAIDAVKTIAVLN